jgi:hypothetical protein
MENVDFGYLLNYFLRSKLRNKSTSKIIVQKFIDCGANIWYYHYDSSVRLMMRTDYGIAILKNVIGAPGYIEKYKTICKNEIELSLLHSITFYRIDSCDAELFGIIFGAYNKMKDFYVKDNDYSIDYIFETLLETVKYNYDLRAAKMILSMIKNGYVIREKDIFKIKMHTELSKLCKDFGIDDTKLLAD